MRRWIVLLVVMELALLAIYVPTLCEFTGRLSVEQSTTLPWSPVGVHSSLDPDSREQSFPALGRVRLYLASILYPELLGPTEAEHGLAVDLADDEWQDAGRQVAEYQRPNAPSPISNVQYRAARDRLAEAAKAVRAARTITRDIGRADRATVALVAYGVLTACWLVALYWLGRCKGRLDRRTWRVVLIGSAVLAVTLWGLPPTFSNDAYRYRWDGLAAAEGYNPYVVKPDSLWQQKQTRPHLYFPTKDWGWQPTIYPSFGVLLFTANGMAGNTMLGWRAMLLAAEGLLAFSGLAILRRRGLGSGWLAGLLLCPVLLMETHLDGHVELAAVALVVAAVAALDQRRWAVSAALLALAVNIKYLWPALAAIMLLGRLARRGKLALAGGSAVFLATLVLCWTPFGLLTWEGGQPSDSGKQWPAWVPAPLRLVLKVPLQSMEKYNFNARIYKVLYEQFNPDALSEGGSPSQPAPQDRPRRAAPAQSQADNPLDSARDVPLDSARDVPLDSARDGPLDSARDGLVADVASRPESPAPRLIMLGVTLLLVAALIWRRRWWLDLEDIGLVLAVALLLSPVSNPWYFLWLAPGLLMLGPGPLWGSGSRKGSQKGGPEGSQEGSRVGSRVGPPVWIVAWLAMLPALHESLPAYFRTGSAEPFAPVAWMIVLAVVPLLVVAWRRRLARPRFGLAGDD